MSERSRVEKALRRHDRRAENEAKPGGLFGTYWRGESRYGYPLGLDIRGRLRRDFIDEGLRLRDELRGGESRG